MLEGFVFKEVNPDKKPEAGSGVFDSAEETLVQKEETIETPFSLEDFTLFKKVSEKIKEILEKNPDAHKKIADFALRLYAKHGESARDYALFHIISGSTIDHKMMRDLIKKVDFDGEDSISRLIDSL